MFRFFQKKKSRGFTLVEIMVAISIVGLLTSLALAGYEDVKRNLRNAERLSDAKQIELALELYLADNGTYPQRYASLKSTQCTPAEIASNSGWSGLVSDLAPYMDLDGDPLCNKGQSGYNYYYVSNSGDGYRTYGFMMQFESPCSGVDADLNGGFYNSSSCIWYEFGQQPRYCKDQNKTWLYNTSAVCNSD